MKDRVFLRAASLLVMVAIAGCATPMSKFHALQAHPEKLRSFCERLALSTPGVKNYLDTILREHSWYSTVLAVTLSAHRAPSVGAIAVNCPATLTLADGTRLEGNLYYYLPLSYVTYREKLPVAWETDPASEEKARRNYFIREVGKRAYDRWRQKFLKWTACAERPHGVRARAFTNSPPSLPLWALERQIEQGASDATIEACGMPPRLAQAAGTR